jgi:hypothetical protein
LDSIWRGTAVQRYSGTHAQVVGVLGLVDRPSSAM